MRKPDFAYAKTKAQISCAVTAQLISAFDFATQIVQSLFFLNLRFQPSSLLVLFVSGLVGNPEDRFSHVMAQLISAFGFAVKYHSSTILVKSFKLVCASSHQKFH